MRGTAESGFNQSPEFEPVIWDLANELGKRGHKVTLIAAKGSKAPINGELYEVTGGRLNFDDETAAFGQYSDILGSFDILSDHTHQHFVYQAAMCMPDLVIQTTRHSQWNPGVPAPKSPNPNVPRPEPKPYNFCGISNHHSRECSGMVGVPFRTLYDGVDLDRYPFQEKKGDRLLFVGRMEPFKGAHWATWAARTLRMPLDLIGKDKDTNQDYANSIKKEVADAQAQGLDIQYLGEVDHDTKVKYLQNAKALLFPALWSEPFGLVPVEAMACGTAVIGTTNGAQPEVISHSKTGWLASNMDEFADYILKSDQIDPHACREWVEERFSAQVMTNNYLQAWKDILEGRCW